MALYPEICRNLLQILMQIETIRIQYFRSFVMAVFFIVVFCQDSTYSQELDKTSPPKFLPSTATIEGKSKVIYQIKCTFLEKFAPDERKALKNLVHWEVSGNRKSYSVTKIGTNLKDTNTFFLRGNWNASNVLHDSLTVFFTNKEGLSQSLGVGKSVSFNGAEFDEPVFLRQKVFHTEAEFSGAKFRNGADFREAKFTVRADFSEAEFKGWANFSEATFEEVSFEDARFYGQLDLTKTHFKQEIELRRIYFDSVENIYIENIRFPVGKLRFKWDQFKGKESLRIKLALSPVDSLEKEEHYTRIEIIYHRLRDNFLAQNDKASGDAVMFELAVQRKEILDEWSWKWYYYVFGFGYEPWRFLLFVVLPTVIIFSFVWYFAYYNVLLNAVFRRDMPKELGPQQGSVLLKAWHAIFFSFSVLLGVRFKKEWLIKHHNYLFWVTLQWVIGIGLFVTFALLVKGARFGFIRDLLGF